MFNTTDLVTDTVKLENVFYIDDVTRLFNIDFEAENYIVIDGQSTTYRMSAGAAETFAKAYSNDNATLYFTEKEVYLSEGDGALSMATINSGIVGDFKIVTDDANLLTVDGSTVYYISELYENNGYTCGDLYSYSNTTKTRLAKDVMYYSINLYNDGMILAYTEYEGSSGYELTMIDSKGEDMRIADNVTQYIRVDKSTILYISDGDLYYYNGKEKNKIGRDVDWLWSLKEMEIIHTLGWNDYYYK